MHFNKLISILILSSTFIINGCSNKIYNNYSNPLLDSNKIRSSTGLSIDWYTPIGPLSFSFAQPITKADSDITEGFRFDIGTTF